MQVDAFLCFIMFSLNSDGFFSRRAVEPGAEARECAAGGKRRGPGLHTERDGRRPSSGRRIRFLEQLLQNQLPYIRERAIQSSLFASLLIPRSWDANNIYQHKAKSLFPGQGAAFCSAGQLLSPPCSRLYKSVTRMRKRICNGVRITSL